MKTTMKVLWCSLVLAVAMVSAGATNYTVKAGGGGNYTTIQACATAMANGDTCTVFVGTYNEHVTVTAGGVASYKILTVNPGDTVNVLDFTINSHNKINGFSITNPSSPNSSPCVSVASLSTDYFITNNTMTECGGGVAAIYEPASTTGTSFGYIGGNRISYTCSTPAAPNVCNAIVVIGNHVLVENNDISHTTNGVRALGQHIVIRKNTFHDILGTSMTPSDCGSNSSNCHIVFVQQDSDTLDSFHPPAQYSVIENNTVLNAQGHDTKFGLFQAEVCQGNCFNSIIRFNTALHLGSGVIVDDNSLVTTTTGWYNVKSYNNSWIDVNNYPGNNTSGKGSDSFTDNSTNGSDINNIFYYTVSLTNFNPYYSDASSAPFSYGHNLAWCTTGSSNFGIHGHVYGSGNFTDDPGNQVADPLFVNYANNDSSLLSGSLALAAGTHLTTVASSDSGSGTSLVVNDAGFFQDGYSIPGVNADCIAVRMVANHVCITAVNYQTKTLTLASSITRSAGDPVWLYSDSTGRTVLIGSAPNIGATFDPAPAGLTAAVK